MMEFHLRAVLRALVDSLFIPGAGQSYELLLLYLTRWKNESRQLMLLVPGLFRGSGPR